MKQTKETFATLMKEFEHRYDIRTAFDDFLTLVTCAFSQNPATGVSYDEDLYLRTMEPYKNDNLRHNFPKMIACLTKEMTQRLGSSRGNDVLGEFYEEHLYRKGASQYFTPWPICVMLAKIGTDGIDAHATHEPLRILDPSCGSGRILLASSKENGTQHNYYGIDIDHTCVKMAVINLFLNGLFRCEVMCSDALDPDDFRGSYRTSFLPFGIFRIAEKEKSRLHWLHKNSFQNIRHPNEQPEMVHQGKRISAKTQLKLF